MSMKGEGMSENTPTPETPLQFNTAEYSGSLPAVTICAACKSPLTQSYYTANKADLMRVLPRPVQGPFWRPGRL